MDTLRLLTCGGSRMKRLVTLLALLVFPAWEQDAYADSVPTFTAQANIGMSFSPGGNDAQSTFEGPGISLNGFGNVICDWGGGGCGTVLTPGSSLNPSFSQIDFGPAGPGGTLTLGGQQFVCQGPSVLCSLEATGITAFRNITFPTNGQNFTVTVPAATGPLSGAVVLESGEQLFNVQIPPGQLELFFSFENMDGPGWQIQGAVFSTPEPGTLGLMAAGLAGIILRLFEAQTATRDAEE